ncbi:hypothetical protein CU097_010680 [Rhizopus azygosporus]|uniref:Uncharacterized protein n=1 Tax=Rhizopus azygosporus TaxID=86630 RepID=A0A367JGE5_RHIAZ|nr:hypothetical protein CU097_010680 [Rhizopus azygosporus]
MPITQNVWVIFTQYSDKQPLDLDMTDPELPDRMDQLEKTINASLKTKKSASGRVSDAVEELTKNFKGFTLKETVVGKFIPSERNLSIKTMTRHLVARNQSAKIKERRKWVEAWSKTDINYIENCIFIDESAFDISMKLPTVKISSRNSSHSCGVANMEIRVPLTSKRIKVMCAQKRKATTVKAKTQVPRIQQEKSVSLAGAETEEEEHEESSSSTFDMKIYLCVAIDSWAST